MFGIVAGLPSGVRLKVMLPSGEIEERAGNMNPVRGELDGTTDKTTSHLTKPLKRQVIGYSHPTRLSKDASQVVGYVEPCTGLN